MRNLLITLFVFLIPVLAQAEEPAEVRKERHIVIKTTDGTDEKALREVMERVEAETAGEDEVFVTVTTDDSGDVKIHKMEPGARHFQARAMRMESPMGHGPMVHGMMMPEPMNKAAAECVVKHISKLNTDAAAHLLHQACRALAGP